MDTDKWREGCRLVDEQMIMMMLDGREADDGWRDGWTDIQDAHACNPNTWEARTEEFKIN